VRAGAAVGVDDDLAAGQAAVALRAADDEAAGRVDQVLGVALSHSFGSTGLMISSITASMKRASSSVRHRSSRGVLGGQHHGVDAVRLAVHVAHGHLALGVGAQEGQAAVLAQLRLALDQAVRVVDRRGISSGVSSQA
jgi:hypothetical protein